MLSKGLCRYTRVCIPRKCCRPRYNPAPLCTHGTTNLGHAGCGVVQAGVDRASIKDQPLGGGGSRSKQGWSDGWRAIRGRLARWARAVPPTAQRLLGHALPHARLPCPARLLLPLLTLPARRTRSTHQRLRQVGK